MNTTAELVDGKYLIVYQGYGTWLLTSTYIIDKVGAEYHKYSRKTLDEITITSSDKKLFKKVFAKTTGEQIYVCRNDTKSMWTLLNELTKINI